MACRRACLPFCVSSVHPHLHDRCAVFLCLCQGYRVPVREAEVSLLLHRCGGLVAKPVSTLVSGFAGAAIKREDGSAEWQEELMWHPSVSHDHRDRAKGPQRGDAPDLLCWVCGVAPLLQAGSGTAHPCRSTIDSLIQRKDVDSFLELFNGSASQATHLLHPSAARSCREPRLLPHRQACPESLRAQGPGSFLLGPVPSTLCPPQGSEHSGKGTSIPH